MVDMVVNIKDHPNMHLEHIVGKIATGIPSTYLQSTGKTLIKILVWGGLQDRKLLGKLLHYD